MLNSIKISINCLFVKKKCFLISSKIKYSNYLHRSKTKPDVSFFTFLYIPECWSCPKYYTIFSTDFQFFKKMYFVLKTI